MSDLSSAIFADHDTQGATKSGRKHCHAWRVAFDAAGLRRFLVKQHPVKTAEHVAEKTGLPLRSVHRWMSDQASEPSLSNFIRLTAVYGPQLLAAALSPCPAWLDDHARLAKAAEYRRKMREYEIAYRDLLDGDR